MRKSLQVFTIFSLFILSSLSAQAQCAMCKAVAESSTEAGSTVATGLNGGIIYLVAFPYLIMGVVGYAIYRHRKQQTQSKPE
jgi:type III secretory pathway component EscU